MIHSIQLIMTVVPSSVNNFQFPFFEVRSTASYYILLIILLLRLPLPQPSSLVSTAPHPFLHLLHPNHTSVRNSRVVPCPIVSSQPFIGFTTYSLSASWLNHVLVFDSFTCITRIITGWNTFRSGCGWPGQNQFAPGAGARPDQTRPFPFSGDVMIKMTDTGKVRSKIT